MIKMTHLVKLGLFLSAEEQKILINVVKFRIRIIMSSLLQFLIRYHYILFYQMLFRIILIDKVKLY